MNTKPKWRDFGGPTEKNPTRYLACNRVYWNTDSLKSLLEVADEDADAWKTIVDEELKERDKAGVNKVWNGRNRFPVVLARPLPRNARNKKFFGEGLLLWLHFHGVDGRLAGDKEGLEQRQKNILSELPFDSDAVDGILHACRIAKAYSAPPVLLRREAGGPCFEDIKEGIKGGSASLAVATWLTWHKRHLWPSKPLVITGELTEDGKVKSVEKLKEKLAAAKDRGVDFLVTPGEPGAKDPEGLIKVPGEGKKLEEWLETCEQKLRKHHQIYLTHSWPSRSFLEKKREGFVGRQWLRQEIEEWSKTKPDERGLLLLGKLGSGKSSFVADLVLREEWEPTVLACHVCRHGRTETCNANNLITQLAGMLSDSMPAFRRQRESQRHQDVSGRLNISGSTADYLERELLAPLRGLENFEPGHICYLVVDGLDESLNSGGNEDLGIPQLLEQVAEELPAWLRLIATSRPVGEVTRHLPWSVRQLEEGENEIHNRQDLRDYLNEQLKKPTVNEKLRDQLRNSNLTTNQAVQPLFEKSKGNFLYLKEALNGLEKGWYQWDKIPDDLSGIYLGYFKRLFKSKSALEHYNDNVEPLLSLIVEAKEPLSASELCEIHSCRKKDVEKVLDPLESYIDLIKDRYEICHSAFADWLAGRVSSDRKHDRHPFVVDPEESRESLTHWCFKQFNNKEATMSDYTRRHLIAHLVELQRWEEVRTVFTSYEFLRERVEQGETAELISDCELAASVVGSKVQSFAKLLGGAMQLSEGPLRNDISHLQSQLMGRLLDSGAPDIQLLLRDVTLRARKPWLRPCTRSLIAPGGPLIRTLRGHTDTVTSVALTPDGRRAVSGSWDRTLKVWDLETGTARPLDGDGQGHTDRVNAVSLTPDGRRAVSASWDNTLKLWDLETRALLRTLEGHSEAVRSVAVTPDGRRSVSGSKDWTLKVWDLETGTDLLTLEDHTDNVNAVSLTPDGRRAVSASWDNTLKIWDLETGKKLRTLKDHTDKVWSVVVTPDGRRAVSASWDNTLKVWDLDKGVLLRTLEGHADKVWSVVVTPDGRRAISGSKDRTLKVWDLETGDVLRTLEGHAGNVETVSLTSDGRRAVSASSDRTLKVWDLETSDQSGTLEGHTEMVWSLAVTPDGRRAVSGSWDHTLKVWELDTGTLLRTLEGHKGRVLAVSLTPDGSRAVSGSWDKTLKVWDMGTGTVLTLKDHTDIVWSVAVTPDGRHAISGSKDKTLKVWELETGTLVRTLEGHSDMVVTVSLTPDGRRAVSASSDKTLKVWDLDKGALLRTLEGHSDIVGVGALTPDGNRAVSGAAGRTLKVWDLESGGLPRMLDGQTGWGTSVSLTSDGRLAVSASGDSTLKVWDVESGQCLRTLEGHTGGVTSVSMTPDGRRAVSGSCDKTLRVWDVTSRQCLRTLEGHTDMVWSVSLTPDGRRGVSASDDNTLKVWDLETGKVTCSYEIDTRVSAVKFSSDGLSICAGDVLGHIHFLHLESGD